MNVLQVVAHFPYPPLGGMESVIYNLSIELAKLGHTVRIVAPSQSLRSFKLRGVFFTSVPSWMIYDRLFIPRPRGLGLLMKYIYWADVIHVHSPHNTYTQLSAFLSKLTCRPLILSVLCHTALLRHPSPLGKLAGLFLEPIAQTLLWAADTVHVKNALDRALVSHINSRVVYVPDGVLQNLFSAKKCSKSFKVERGLEDAYPIVLYLGRLHPMKGPQEVIRMLPSLLKHYPKAVAVLVGPSHGDYVKDLAHLAERTGVSERVIFTGPLNEKRKIHAIDAADIVAIPSLSDIVEAFSIVASEAWARGKPVVAYAVGALKYRVREGANGYLAPQRNIHALLEATLKALNLPSVKPPQDVVSWRKVAKVFQQIYVKILVGERR